MGRATIQEHIARMKYLNEYGAKKPLKEDAPMSVNGQVQQPVKPAPTQQPQQNSDQTVDQELDKILNNPQFDQELNNAMGQVTQTLPNDLQQVATTAGDRDGQLEVKEQIGEAGFILAASAVLAVPKLVELMGTGLSKLGVKVSNQTLQKMGDKLSHFGHAIHNKYIGVIETLLKPMTSYMDDQQRKALAGTLLTLIVAGLGVASVAGAVSAVQAGQAGIAALEGGLSGIKGVELAEKVRELLPAALKAGGVS